MKNLLYLLLAFTISSATAQQATTKATTNHPAPVNFTAEQDHQHMMRQLGIKALRPGPSGDPKSPNAANYDEAKANPYPNLPELLTLKNGKKVTTPAQWWNQRRPEIVEEFEREIFGRIPKNVPKVTWKTLISEREMVGWIPVNAKQLVGQVDNSQYPLLEVNINMTVVTPANAKGPVPVLMMFGRSALPAPAQPPKESLEKINAAMKKLLVEADPSLKAVFEQYPAYTPIAPQGLPPFGPPAAGDPPPTHQLLAAGWGYVLIEPGSIQADNGAGLTKGIIGLVNKGQPRKPDDWGALRAWAWGASRGLDYLETDPTVDAKRVGIEGVSRFGKAALVAQAFDQRFAVGLIGSSGEGGAKLHRRNFGEAVESLTSSYEYHWMAGNFLKYGASEATFGPKTANDLPVDAHQLIALCAPRPTFISYGIPEQGDAKWLDQQGSYMATVAAGPAFKLLGARDLGVGHDYKTAKMPGVNVSLLDGELAWRQHDGGHTDAPNFKYFIPWADRMLKQRAASGTGR
ncbi:glucuronyl esterase domain-containing protein [Rufibacter psychrotolerans]|uniref:glucuronyl esterase domain-containing protein n=1 Tax=Rufibacter psychrotolerans TaxID=2812556 RepID=UPI0019680BC9|nr:acetylxylan esterase [Rufibacter sp. SYSU D00308]